MYIPIAYIRLEHHVHPSSHHIQYQMNHYSRFQHVLQQGAPHQQDEYLLLGSLQVCFIYSVNFGS